MDNTVKGELSIISHMLLWSLFPIFTIFTFLTLPSLYSASFSTLFAALFFSIVLAYKKKWSELLIKEAWVDIIIASFFIGVFYYGLYFIGLKFTTAGNASIASLMELFFSFLVLGLWGKEKIYLKKVIGAVLMFIGALILLLPKASGINYGDLIIVSATIITPFGNYFMQRARKKVSSITIMFVRSFISSISLFFLALFFFPLPTFTDITSSLIFLIPNGIIFLGLSKILWIEGIHRIQITKANSLSTITPLFTIIFSYFLLKEVITTNQIFGAIPIIIGANLILKKK